MNVARNERKKSIVRERQQNATTTTRRNTIGTTIYTFVLVSLFVINIIRHGETWVFQQKEKNCQGEQSICIVHKVVHFNWVVLVITPKITKTWHHKAKAVLLLSHTRHYIYVRLYICTLIKLHIHTFMKTYTSTHTISHECHTVCCAHHKNVKIIYDVYIIKKTRSSLLE